MWMLLFELAALAYVPRQRPYDVRHYELLTTLDIAGQKFSNDVTTTLVSNADSSELRFDAVHLAVANVTVDGVAVPFSLSTQKGQEDAGEIIIQAPVKKGQTYQVRIVQSGRADPGQNGAFVVDDPDDKSRGPLFATTFEAVAARRFFACNDEPHDKATVRITIIGPEGYTLLSNGVRQAKALHQGPEGTTSATYTMEQPIATYLLTVVAGQFTEVVDTDPRLQYYLDPKKTDRAQPLKESTRHVITFLSDYLRVPYAYPVYRQISVPRFRWSGMENTTATVMKASRILPDDPSSDKEVTQIYALVAHELAHQWFGDLVTNAWWNDVWLNEAFASFLEGRAGRDFFKDEASDLDDFKGFQTGYLRDEASPLGHAIVQNELPSPNDAFDGISYTKGSLVLRTLATYLGEDAFRRGLQTYLTRHAHGVATSADFIRAMSDASSEPLDEFARAWLYERGYPQLSMTQRFEPPNGAAAKGKLVLTFVQKASTGSVTEFPMRVPVRVHRRAVPAFDEAATVSFAGPKASVTIELPAEPEWVTVDPEFSVLTEVVSRPNASEQYAAQAQFDPSPIARLMGLRQLARPWFDKAHDTSGAKLPALPSKDEAAIVMALSSERSAYVQSTFMDLLFSLPTERLPASFAMVVRALFNKESGDRPTLADTLRRVSAATLLGRFSDPETTALLKRSLFDQALPLDLLRPVALSAASNKEGLLWLRQVQKKHASRGYAYSVVMREALAACSHPDVVDELRRAFLESAKDGDAFQKVVRRLATNKALIRTTQGAKLLGALSLDEAFDEEQRADLLSALGAVRSKEPQAVLRQLRSSLQSARLKELADRSLRER